MVSITNASQIEANRTGQITDAQAEALVDRHDVTFPLFVLSLPLMVAVALLIAGLVVVGGTATLGGSAEDVPTIALFCLFLVCLLFTVLAVFSFIQFLKRILVYPRVNRLLENPIVSSQGQVAWRGRKYTVLVDGKRLKPVFDFTVMPAPGTYMLYYLRGTPWLLSADPIEGRAEDSDRLLLEALMQANKFRVNVLPANRDGRFGMGQRSLVLRQLFNAYNNFIGVLIGLLIFGGILIYFLARTDMAALISDVQGVENGPTFLLIAGGGGLLCGGLFVVGIIMSVRDILLTMLGLQLDLLFGRLRSAEGIVTRFVDSSGDSEGPSYTHYYYKLDDLQFRVSSKAHDALVPGRAYRVYYTPTLIRYGEGLPRRLLINIEPIPQTNK